jgi:hypothetical protein
MRSAFSSMMFNNIAGQGFRNSAPVSFAPVRIQQQPGYVQRVNQYSGPMVSRNNPVAVNAFRNFDMMANNRMFTRGFAQPTASGYTEAHNNMRNLVHMGEGYRVSVRDAMNRDLAMRNRPPKVITRTITRPSTGRVNLAGGQQPYQNNAWRDQQNSAGLGRNRRYSNGMSQFAINNSANSGLNRMR